MTAKTTTNTEDATKATPMPELNPSNARTELMRYGEANLETVVLLRTSMGNIKIKLYDDTPLHRANFVMLGKKKFYDGMLFYRIIKDFMVQGGGTDDVKHFKKKERIGRYKIPSETSAGHYHKRGAVAMAKYYENNPEGLSESFDFFIVQGLKYSDADLSKIGKENKLVFSEEQRKAYTSIGGAPHLDKQHTVFGEVIEGMNVVDAIAAVPVSPEDYWPKENVMILGLDVIE